MKNLLRGQKLDQQVIVLVLFVLIFLLFALLLPGFTSAGNILTLVRSVSVLRILGLGMAIVVIGRGIDLSMIATLAVPAALVMTLAGAGYHPVVAIFARLGFAIATGLLNGLLVAYAEIPALFATLAVGIGVAGIGQSGMFEYDIIAWPQALNSISWSRTRKILRGPLFDPRLPGRRAGRPRLSQENPHGLLHIRDRRQSPCGTHFGSPGPPHHHAAICDVVGNCIVCRAGHGSLIDKHGHPHF